VRLVLQAHGRQAQLAAQVKAVGWTRVSSRPVLVSALITDR